MIALGDGSKLSETVVEEPSTIGVLLVLVVPVVALAVIGAIISAVVWWIWQLIFGHIPQFLGFSRFWPDVISGAFWTPIISYFIFMAKDDYNTLSRNGEYYVSLSEIFWDNPLRNTAGIIATIIYVASWFLSLAAGLAVCAVLGFFILAGGAVWTLAGYAIYSIGNIFASFSAGETEENNS